MSVISHQSPLILFESCCCLLLAACSVLLNTAEKGRFCTQVRDIHHPMDRISAEYDDDDDDYSDENEVPHFRSYSEANEFPADHDADDSFFPEETTPLTSSSPSLSSSSSSSPFSLSSSSCRLSALNSSLSKEKPTSSARVYDGLRKSGTFEVTCFTDNGIQKSSILTINIL